MLGNAVQSAVKLLSASEMNLHKIQLMKIQKQRKPASGFGPFRLKRLLSRVFCGSKVLHKTWQWEKFMLKGKDTEWEASDGWWDWICRLSPHVIQKAGDDPVVRASMQGMGLVPGCGCRLQLLFFAPGPHEGLDLTALRQNIRC